MTDPKTAPEWKEEARWRFPIGTKYEGDILAERIDWLAERCASLAEFNASLIAECDTLRAQLAEEKADATD